MTRSRFAKARWLLVIPVVLIALALGGTWAYINLIRDEAPTRLTLSNGATTTTVGAITSTDADAAAAPAPEATAPATAAAEALNGSWEAAEASQVGYRVKEVLFGQDTEGVGRTNAVTGQMQIAGTVVTAGSFSVDLTQMKSDEDRRDGQFQGRIMDTAAYPTATFELGAPIELNSLPADQVEVGATATGELTLRGMTRAVTFELLAQRNGATIEVNGAIPIVFAEWGIPNPSIGPITTEDNGELEFLLVFDQAA